MCFQGGAFYFLEHVVSDPSTWTYFFQHVLERLWFYLMDGCRITRATWADLEGAGFSQIRLQRVDAPEVTVLIRPHIMGYAIKWHHRHVRAIIVHQLSQNIFIYYRICNTTVCSPLPSQHLHNKYQPGQCAFPALIVTVTVEQQPDSVSHSWLQFATLEGKPWRRANATSWNVTVKKISSQLQQRLCLTSWPTVGFHWNDKCLLNGEWGELLF